MVEARSRSRRSLAELAQSWDELEDWERDEWWKLAPQFRIRIRRRWDGLSPGKPRTRPMRGAELYTRISRVLDVCGYERRRLPSPAPRFHGNPVMPILKISFVKGRLVIKLVLREAPAADIMVFGSPPRRAHQLESKTPRTTVLY
jgi:hypothetical protein